MSPGSEAHRAVLERLGERTGFAGFGANGFVEQPAAGGEPHVDDLDRIVRVRIPVGRLVDLQEPFAQGIRRRDRNPGLVRGGSCRAGCAGESGPVGEAGRAGSIAVAPRRDRNGKLEVLPHIARIDREFEPPAPGGDPFCVEPGAGPGGQGVDLPGEAPVPRGVPCNAFARDEVLLEIGDDQTLRAQDPRRRGHEDLANPERERDIARVQRSGASEGHEGEFPRVVSPLHRDGADRSHHVGHDDAEHAMRGAFDVESEPLGHGRERGPRQRLVEPHLAREQATARQSSEHEVRVRHRGTVAASPVACGARNGAGARRADLEQFVAIEPGNRAAAGAHRLDVHRREAHGEAGDVAIERDVGLKIANQRDIGARAPHVEGDDVAPAGELRRMRRADRTRRGPRQRGAHGKGARPSGRHQATARLVDADGGVGRHAGEPVFEGREIAPEHGLQVRVQHRGGEPLVLAELGLDLERGAYRDVREGGSNRGRDTILVPGVAEREQQAHGAGVGAARANLLYHRGDGVVGELGHRRAGRVHPLGNLESMAALDERRRVVLGERVHVRAGLAADLEEVAEAPRRDHRDVASLALDERVGAHRGAVGEPAQLPEVDAVPGGQRLQSLDDGPGRVVGRRRPLPGKDRAARLVEHVEVGEGAAYVDADAESGLRSIHLFFIDPLVKSSSQGRPSCAWLRFRKDSASTRIANPVPAAAPCRSPRRPISTNAAVPAMRVPTPVRHPHGLHVRLAGDLWQVRPM